MTLGDLLNDLKENESVDIFNCAELSDILSSNSFNSESAKYKNLISSIDDQGTSKRIIKAKPTMLKQLDKLCQKMPNFSEAIEFIKIYVGLALVTPGMEINIPSIALSGSAGVGKTFFLQNVAEILGLTTNFVSCASVTSDFHLTGTARGYSNAVVGKIAQHYMNDGEANPLFILDEFDKPKPLPNGDFYGVFYTLLEQSQASSFRDEFLDLGIDASHINWMITCNSIDTIPDPLISRLKVFDIPVADKSQIYQIIESIYQEIHREYKSLRNLIFRSSLTEEELSYLSMHSIRQAKLIMREAFARGVLYYLESKEKHKNDYRKIVSRFIAPVFKLSDDLYIEPKKGIGFLANI